MPSAWQYLESKTNRDLAVDKHRVVLCSEVVLGGKTWQNKTKEVDFLDAGTPSIIYVYY